MSLALFVLRNKVPQIELPDPEQEDGNAESSLKAIEKKWADLAINRITNQEVCAFMFYTFSF